MLWCPHHTQGEMALSGVCDGGEEHTVYALSQQRGSIKKSEVSRQQNKRYMCCVAKVVQALHFRQASPLSPAGFVHLDHSTGLAPLPCWLCPPRSVLAYQSCSLDPILEQRWSGELYQIPQASSHCRRRKLEYWVGPRRDDSALLCALKVVISLQIVPRIKPLLWCSSLSLKRRSWVLEWDCVI